MSPSMLAAETGVGRVRVRVAERCLLQSGPRAAGIHQNQAAPAEGMATHCTRCNDTGSDPSLPPHP